MGYRSSVRLVSAGRTRSVQFVFARECLNLNQEWPYGLCVLESAADPVPEFRSSGTGPTTGSSPPAAASLIYDFQSTASSNVIGIFSATASGDAAPEATLVLPTDVHPEALVTDSTGQIYVGGQGNMGDVVLVYPSGATGSATPSRTIIVFSAPSGIAVDATGLLYVGGVGTDGAPQVDVYSATATGSSAPLRSLATLGIQTITALTTDSSGNLYVAGPNPSNDGYISIYPPGTSGSATPSRTIQSDFNFYGLTVDVKGDLFATTDGPNEVQLVEYSTSASGEAVPITTFTLAAPVDEEPFIGSVVQDAAGNFYFAASVLTSRVAQPAMTIYTLAPGFSSTSSPVRTLSPTTSSQVEIAVH